MRLTLECRRHLVNQGLHLSITRRIDNHQGAHTEWPVFRVLTKLHAEVLFTPVGIVVAGMSRSLPETLEGNLDAALAVHFDNRRRERAKPITWRAGAAHVPRMTPERGDDGTARPRNECPQDLIAGTAQSLACRGISRSQHIEQGFQNVVLVEQRHAERLRELTGNGRLPAGRQAGDDDEAAMYDACLRPGCGSLYTHHRTFRPGRLPVPSSCRPAIPIDSAGVASSVGGAALTEFIAPTYQSPLLAWTSLPFLNCGQWARGDL